MNTGSMAALAMMALAVGDVSLPRKRSRKRSAGRRIPFDDRVQAQERVAERERNRQWVDRKMGRCQEAGGV